MDSSVAEIPTIIGTAMGGGFYAGRIMVDGQAFAIIVAPKVVGEHDYTPWNRSSKSVTGALSYNDGFDNTEAMAAAGSKLAKWARDLRIAEQDDWYLPSQDELEVIYRNLKPTTNRNWCYMRSGINLHAVIPSLPYTHDLPAQTQAELFQADGDQAFEATWYWSSTQYASVSDYAWSQDFGDGYQYYGRKGGELRARAVRRLPI